MVNPLNFNRLRGWIPFEFCHVNELVFDLLTERDIPKSAFGIQRVTVTTRTSLRKVFPYNIHYANNLDWYTLPFQR